MSDGFNPLLAMRAILDRTCTLTANERLVALAIVRHADDKGVAWPSLGGLAKATGLCRRSIANALLKLERATHPVTIRHDQRCVTGKLERDSNRYVVTLTGSAPDAPRSALTALGSAPDAPQVVHHVHGGSAPRALEVPNELPIQLPNKKTRASKLAAPADVQRVFDVWNKTLAPVKFPKGATLTEGRKRAIEKALKHSTPDELELAIAGVRKSDFHCTGGHVDLTSIFRDRERIENHMANPTAPMAPLKPGWRRAPEVQRGGYDAARSEEMSAFILGQRKANGKADLF